MPAPVRASTDPWAFRLNQSFAIDSRQCIIGANDLGLVNGHVTMNGRVEDVAQVKGLYAPPYFCGNFVLTLLFDGHRIAADHYIWRPESLMREGRDGNWRVCTRLVPVGGERAAILEVSVENVGPAAADLSVLFDVYGTVGRQEKWGFQKPFGESGWKGGVFSLDSVRPARVAVGWTLGGDSQVTMKAILPGEKRVFHLAFSIGAPEEASEIVRGCVRDPVAAIARSVAGWDLRIARLAARMPVFECDNPAFVRLYERSLLHLLLTEWDVESFALRPYYATGGMNGGCLCNYLWNFGGPYRLWPLLDPDALKAHLRTFLSLDLEKCFAFAPCDGSPLGPYYPINQEKIIFLVDAYVRETGDVEWLRDSVGGRSIIEWVVKMALTHDDITKDAVLADYGVAGETHLELHGKALYDGVMPDLNLRRIALLHLADSLCRMAGYKPKADLVSRAEALKGLARRELWDEKEGWFRTRCSNGESTVRWTIQMFKALGYGRRVLDVDVEEALVAHLMNPAEFLGEYGIHSLSKRDLAYDESDVDNGGPGACPSFAPAICDRLYRDGRYREANKILSRLLWLGEKLPYWGDSQYADRPDYRRDTPLQCDIEGACLAQTIVFGLFGVRIGDDLSVSFDPHLPDGSDRMSLSGLRLTGKSYDVACDRQRGVRVESKSAENFLEGKHIGRKTISTSKQPGNKEHQK